MQNHSRYGFELFIKREKGGKGGRKEKERGVWRGRKRKRKKEERKSEPRGS